MILPETTDEKTIVLGTKATQEFTSATINTNDRRAQSSSSRISVKENGANL